MSWINKISSLFKDLAIILMIFLFIFILGHYLIQGAVIAKRVTLGLPIDDLLILDYNFGEFDEAVDKRKVHPWYYWRRFEIENEKASVDKNGIRKTIKQPNNNAKKIFILGGSTTWGSGVDDYNTIPSLLQKKLGNNFDVYNFGESGYMSIQETNYLLEKLSEGNIPDIVIFYDGHNDGYTSLYSPGVPREPSRVRTRFNRYNKMINFSFTDHIFEAIKRTGWGALFNYVTYGRSDGPERTPFSSNWDATIVDQSIPGKIEKTLNYWTHNVRQINAIGKEYGFKTYSFWQPNPLNESKKLTQDEKNAIGNRVSNKGYRVFKDLYIASSKRLKDKENLGIHWIGDIFQNNSESLYIDFIHLNKYGNKLIADRMYSVLNEEK